MDVRIDPTWKPLTKSEFEKPYFNNLTEFVRAEYRQHTCYPTGTEIFSAFSECPFEKVKIVILGQDPYHGPNQANGLCFSVHEGIRHPPSLMNIFREVEKDVGTPYPRNGDLRRWSRQGILLLNAVLTVRAHQAGSHKNKGWEEFTNAVIKALSTEKEGLIFLLWGSFAKRKAQLIDASRHFILTSGHPSPLSANRGLWFGNRHFSKTNEILKKQGEKPIVW